MNYHHIEVTINTDKKSPFFTGSMLRGAMGYALKKVTCIGYIRISGGKVV